MKFKYTFLFLLVFINSVVGEFLQMGSAPINMNRVIRNISATTITACQMQCEKDGNCKSIVLTENSPNRLPNCLLLREDDGNNGDGNVMTTVQAIGSEPRVNGQWGSWRTTSACSVSCGGGSLTQSRDCCSPNGGDNCNGLSRRTVKCNVHIICPVHGRWGIWRFNSSCSTTCDNNGTFIGRRRCDSPKPRHGGKDCEGKEEKTFSCNWRLCPVHGNWSAWTREIKESLIGRYDVETRQCDSPKPKYGGSRCRGNNERLFSCNTDADPGKTNLSQVVNIASKKQATQSSSYRAASRGNDGWFDSSSKTAKENDPWWSVDLLADVQIECIVFRGGGYEDDYKNVTVLGKSATSPTFQLCKNLGPIRYPYVVNFACDTNQTFRFIKIKIRRNNGALSIKELEVYVKKRDNN